jgi:ectoine hydroxylase-related dioxygenase (phytanoyl-CoA dioxygenase family)
MKIETQKYKSRIEDDGFCIVENVYSEEEVEKIVAHLDNLDSSKPTFRKSKDLFAIRQFLNEVPEVKELVFNDALKQIILEVASEKHRTVKSIFFDKPEQSNWYVAYHQDLTISVDRKLDLEGFGPWTVKQNQFAVQPPIEILEDILTVRIHLDKTTSDNGALKVIPGSHKKGIYRPESINWEAEKEVFCSVQKGGVMLMKPLLLHGSNRTTNSQKRRVIHIEFASKELPQVLKWSERN